MTNRLKIFLLPEEKEFVKLNWQSMTNPELAKSLGLRLTRFRGLLREMGLKRIEMEYWTPEQTNYLLDNYKKIGDTEIANYFQINSPKTKPWSKKHIEKKRRYLCLKRTKEELKQIKTRNRLQGVWNTENHRWKQVECSKNGDIRQWNNPYNNKLFYVIKTEKGFVHYYRWLWKESFGSLPSNKLVVPKKEAPKDTLLKINQLEVIDRTEHAKRNCEIRMQFPSEIRELTRLINKIDKQIKTRNDVRKT